jgi:thiol-disulfide isomerase/thioredoxin
MIYQFQKTKKIAFTAVLITLLSFKINAQIEFAKKQLSIGDPAPGLLLEGVINYHAKTLSISDYKDKLVILDFWSNTCVTCIQSFPKLDSLQKEYNDKIQIILVTKNGEEDVEKLFSKIKIKKPGVPIIVGDKVLSEIFPHNTVPHIIWINKKGIIQHITFGYYINEGNIQSVLNGNKINVPLKKEFADFDRAMPLLKEGDGRLINHIQYYSFLMNRVDEYNGGNSGFIGDSEKRTVGLRIVNSDPLSLYRTAFNNSLYGGEFDYDNRIILEVKDIERFQWPKDISKLDDWQSANFFSYESLLPASQKSELFKIMQTDLNKYLPYEAKIELRTAKCLVLYRMSEKDLIATKGGHPGKIQSENEYKLTNKSMATFVTSIAYNNQNLTTPVVDATAYKGNIDIDLKTSLNNL